MGDLLLNAEFLYILFRFLSRHDLQNASRVNRTWHEIAMEINRTIGPLCVMESTSDDDVKIVKQLIVEKSPITPSLHMFVTLLKWHKERTKSCYCQHLPWNCYSVSIENCWSMEKNNVVIGMFLPDTHNLRVTTVTLNRHISGKGMYCEELKCSFDESFSNADQLKTIFRPVFNNNLSTNNCLILLYKYNAYPILENLILTLQEWFPDKNASIFGGMVDNLSICNKMDNSHICNLNADCISIIIRGRDMQTWTLKLNGFYDGYRLIMEFKDTIVLKTHSIGFMITGECCLKYSLNRESLNFTKVFPTVPIFQIYGFETIEATSSNGLFKKLCNKWDRMENLVFLIITYN